jgi:hypothetical protein
MRRIIQSDQDFLLDLRLKRARQRGTRVPTATP